MYQYVRGRVQDSYSPLLCAALRVRAGSSGLLLYIGQVAVGSFLISSVAMKRSMYSSRYQVRVNEQTSTTAVLKHVDLQTVPTADPLGLPRWHTWYIHAYIYMILLSVTIGSLTSSSSG